MSGGECYFRFKPGQENGFIVLQRHVLPGTYISQPRACARSLLLAWPIRLQLQWAFFQPFPPTMSPSVVLPLCAFRYPPRTALGPGHTANVCARKDCPARLLGYFQHDDMLRFSFFLCRFKNGLRRIRRNGWLLRTS